jgi:hypothetical protein
MALVRYWTPYCITRTGDSTFAPSSPNADWIVRNLADEILEAITDPAPPTQSGGGFQYGWVAGKDPGTSGISKWEIVDPCEAVSNARSTTYSDGFRVPYYWDKITRKCVAPGTGASPVSLSSNPTFDNAGAGPVLRNSSIFLVFWGTTWGSQTTLKTAITSGIQTKLLSTHVDWFSTAKADYDGFTYPTYAGTSTWTGNVPANTAAIIQSIF